MKQKLNCILLIDDDYPTNYYHRIVINNTDCAKKVLSCQSATKALDLLTSIDLNKEVLPDLIFLDINMPGMNGWEFLEAYKELDISKSPSASVLMMLSTSSNIKDIERAEKIEALSGFISKPLSEEVIEELMVTYFSNESSAKDFRREVEN